MCCNWSFLGPSLYQVLNSSRPNAMMYSSLRPWEPNAVPGPWWLFRKCLLTEWRKGLRRKKTMRVEAASTKLLVWTSLSVFEFQVPSFRFQVTEEWSSVLSSSCLPCNSHCCGLETLAGMRQEAILSNLATCYKFEKQVYSVYKKKKKKKKRGNLGFLFSSLESESYNIFFRLHYPPLCYKRIGKSTSMGMYFKLVLYSNVAICCRGNGLQKNPL